MFLQNAERNLSAMCEQGNVQEAIEYVELVHRKGLQMSSKSYGFLLQTCASMKALDEGMRLHAFLISSDVHMDTGLINGLLSLYVKCNRLNEAKVFFKDMGSAKDVVSWTLMINACAQYGEFNEAMKLYYAMDKRSIRPNRVTYVCLLKACNHLLDGLTIGKILHEDIVRRRLEGDPFVGGALMDMYFKFGQVKSARKAFNAIQQKNSFLWNNFISSLVSYGRNKEALKMYHQMQSIFCIEPNETTWIHILKSCGDLEQLEEGRTSHFCICRDGISVDGPVGQELVHMYLECGCLMDARYVFDKMNVKSGSLWKHLIESYKEHGYYDEVSSLVLQMEEFEKLQLESIQNDRPDK
ncbi:hypothetical protein KP509_29G052000 [Ceratopteris richardii]|nr:hypothetical protein KP509_29G052000 [Ceratopteris richardii]